MDDFSVYFFVCYIPFIILSMKIVEFVYVGHFLLTNLLLETMKSTSHNSGIEGRIIILSSDGHSLTYWDGIRFNKINNQAK